MGWKQWFGIKTLEEYLSPEDQAQIAEAIGRAEGRTSGEFRIHLELHCSGDPLERARDVFHRLGMRRTAERNAVLIYFALEARKFALYGDSGIHQRAGEEFWKDTVTSVSQRIRGTHKPAEGLCLAVEAVGERLSLHFPRQADDRNELSDEISFHAG